MRVLWLTGHDINFENNNSNDGYNGRGWISSLQNSVEKNTNIELGLVLLSTTQRNCIKIKNTSYFTILQKRESRIQKMLRYYGGYKKVNNLMYVPEILQIIYDFKPDVIQLFGIENAFSTIIGNTNVPTVIHIQGILGAVSNAFYPAGINTFSFVFPITFREWILRNGVIFTKKNMEVRADVEQINFKKSKYFIGRTTWDFQVSQLLSPNSKYFYVNETLREVFYQNLGKWQFSGRKKLRIISTISETLYKGLDLILKTASILKLNTDLDFEWFVVGLSTKSKMVTFFEKSLKIESKDVNIIFIGILCEEELCKIELNADIYVHTSYIDNSSNSICEAQILGLPVIATNVGGISSLIEHNVNGILVPANAPFELSYNIKRLYKNEKECNRISISAKDTAQHRHNEKRIIDNLQNCYDKIIINKS